MQWMIPESRLGQEQTLILNECVKSGQTCDWIQGFAGSGKTVLLVHAMEQLRGRKPDMSMCFVTFTHALKDLVRTGLSDKTKDIDIQTVDQFINAGRRYDVLFVDEIQDLEAYKLAKLRAMCDKLVVAGDPEQSIYDTGLDADSIQSTLKPRTHKLTVLYRLTQTLHHLARALLPSSPIAGAKVQRQQDTDVVLAHAESPTDEARWVIDRALTLAKPGRPALIILPTQDGIFDFIEAAALARGIAAPERQLKLGAGNNGQKSRRRLDWEAINQQMANRGLPVRYLGSGFGSLDESDRMPLVYVMTYHSAKGLDFPNVFLPRMNSGTRLWRDDENLERRLFFVGVTRSWENLFITHSSPTPHSLISELPAAHIQKRKCAIGKKAGADVPEEPLF
jgi:superfamily I DNA/RNA helicase